MMTNDAQETFDLVLRAFGDAARKNYGDCAFQAGYLHSLSVQLFGMVPKKYQKTFIEDMVRAARKQETEVIQKMNQNQTFEKV